MVGAAMEAESIPLSCAWCNRELDRGDCWVARAEGGGEEAGFCRLEHIVPWAIRGRGWEGSGVILVRYRAGRRITEEFASVDDVAAWAKSGGPWQ